MEINWVRANNRLWKIINGPVYMSGSEFLNYAREIDDSIPSYNEFIEERRNKDLNTSRKDFFWDVIKAMTEDEKLEFFNAMIEELEPKKPEGLESLKALFDGQEAVIKKKEVPSPKFPNEVYQDVLSTLFDCYRNAEQKPSIYKDKGEEDLRDYGLSFLESRYENATAAGEAFNKEGKTDIILKGANGENLFVAECKIWHGKDQFHGAIEQLFGYLTWRDTKAALIFFVRNKKFSEVLEKIKQEATQSEYCIEFVSDTHETSLAFKFRHRDDTDREVQIEFMAFAFPEE